MAHPWQLAQINIARLIAPAGDRRVAGFFAELERINALADASAGFVWRLQDDAGDATAIQPTPDPHLIVNMSVWVDAESLFAFTYRSAHTSVMAQRRSWMETATTAYQALWWIESGTRPSVDEGLARLWMLDRFGPSPKAFSFKARFPAPGTPGDPLDMQPDPWCFGRA